VLRSSAGLQLYYSEVSQPVYQSINQSNDQSLLQMNASSAVSILLSGHSIVQEMCPCSSTVLMVTTRPYCCSEHGAMLRLFTLTAVLPGDVRERLKCVSTTAASDRAQPYGGNHRCNKRFLRFLFRSRFLRFLRFLNFFPRFCYF